MFTDLNRFRSAVAWNQGPLVLQLRYFTTSIVLCYFPLLSSPVFSNESGIDTWEKRQCFSVLHPLLWIFPALLSEKNPILKSHCGFNLAPPPPNRTTDGCVRGGGHCVPGGQCHITANIMPEEGPLFCSSSLLHVHQGTLQVDHGPVPFQSLLPSPHPFSLHKSEKTGQI